MSDNQIHQSDETLESFELPDNVTAADFGAPDEAPEHRTVLEVWREVLRPAKKEGLKPVAPQWASKIVSTYAGLTFKQMTQVRDLYFSFIGTLLTILELEIDGDDECLKQVTVEDDATLNAHHYKNVLMNWQLQFQQWELEWDTESDDAAAHLAAMSECHKMFFSGQGLVPYLESINFEFSEADQQDLADALRELVDSAQGGEL